VRHGLRLACGSSPDKVQFRLPIRRVCVGKGQADDDDAAAEAVGEVYAFGEGAVDYGEEDGSGVVVAGIVVVVVVFVGRGSGRGACGSGGGGGG